MSLVLVVALVGCCAAAWRGSAREALLRGVTLFGVAIAGGTEALGAVEALRPGAVLAWWVLVSFVSWGLAARRFWRKVRGPGVQPEVWRAAWPRVDWAVALWAAASAAILGVTGVTAAVSAPNSADAMVYHLPRVLYWAEQASVRYFPTPYLNQIMLQPFAEYAMLQTYLLSGGDRWVNLVQWFASVVSIVGVSAIAKQMGAGPRGQAFAALFCATVPAGVLASSGAKNDYVLAMWLVVAVYFALQSEAALWLGAAAGMALFTKGTAYLFLPWLLGAVLLARRWLPRRAWMAAVCLLAINAPLYVRNVDLSGSPLGFDSAQGNGYFRWQNETYGWRQTVSNLLRHGAEQLGTRSESRNQALYRGVLTAHRWLGMDVNDPADTWREEEYGAPRNANHEANAAGVWHLVVLVAIMPWLFWKRKLPALYLAALVCGVVSLCAYLKWQPFMSRLFLPLFVGAAPLTGLTRWSVVVAMAVSLVLVDGARRPALENWTRPLRGVQSVWRTPRDDQYFADMATWNNAAAYKDTVALLAGEKCEVVGIDMNHFQLEYPLQALLRERRPGVQFEHTGVVNASAKYRQPVSGAPCAVVCLDCAEYPEQQALYKSYARRVTVGKFVVFLTP